MYCTSLRTIEHSFFCVLFAAAPSWRVHNLILDVPSFFQISGPLLDGGQVRSIVDEIKQVIMASSSRKRERAERAKAEDFDAEEGELLKEENEEEEMLFGQVCS